MPSSTAGNISMVMLGYDDVRSWVVSKCVVYIYQTCTKNNLDTNNTNYGVVLVMNPEVEILHCLRTPRSTILRLAFLVRSVNRLHSCDGFVGLSTRCSSLYITQYPYSRLYITWSIRSINVRRDYEPHNLTIPKKKQKTKKKKSGLLVFTAEYKHY